MIYVPRDIHLIPDELLELARKAQEALESLPADKRVAFIKANADIWQQFKPHLAKMSCEKCWYSESPEVQAHMEVDHYRPKLEAIRAKGVKDEGYRWLAFFWENFRLSAQRSNKRSTNEDNLEIEGKGSWFPLLDGSPKATWDNRCENDERPVLLDPTCRNDVDLVDVDGDGRMRLTKFSVGSAKIRAEKSIEFYGLNLPKLVTARKKVMREIVRIYDNLINNADIAKENPTIADKIQVQELVAQLREKTARQEAYSKAARSQMILLGLSEFCAQPEDDVRHCH